MPDTWYAHVWRLAERGGAVYVRGVLILLLLAAVLTFLSLVGGRIAAAVVSVLP
jgi:hypothetical protein